MRVSQPAGGAAVLDPGAGAWTSVARECIELRPVDIAGLPDGYVRAAWAGRPYGQTDEATVCALRDDERLYVRVEWADDPRPNGEFPDAMGLLFGQGESLATLGSAEAPLMLWLWQDRSPGGAVDLEARGPGALRRSGAGGLDAQGSLEDGRWAVVVSGPAAAARSQLGVVVWNGSNEERAGLAAVSRRWLPLEFE